jgi:hypothetical protein
MTYTKNLVALLPWTLGPVLGFQTWTEMGYVFVGFYLCLVIKD